MATGILPTMPATASPSTSTYRTSSILSHLAFILLLILVAVRPMLQETHTAALPGVLAVLGPIGRATPTLTVALDLLALIAFAFLALSRLLTPRAPAHEPQPLGSGPEDHSTPRCARAQHLALSTTHWLLLPLLLVAAAALISVTAASNKRLALTSATDFAVMLLLLPALVVLFAPRISVLRIAGAVGWVKRSGTHQPLGNELRPSGSGPEHRSTVGHPDTHYAPGLLDSAYLRIAMAAILATAATFAVQCVLKRTSEFGQTIELYNQNREHIWSARGIPLDDPRVILFEKRLYAREVSGFGAHSNVAGAYLAMCALAGLGLAWSRLRARPLPMRRAFALVAALMAVFIAVPIFWTGSKAALASGAIGLALAVWLCLARMANGKRLKANGFIRRPRLALAVRWGLFALLAAGTVLYGHVRGTLPGASLAFRWSYWQNAAGMIRDHWLRGVGMSNFGTYYLRYRPVTSPEEIADPHDMFVRAAAEWGLPGAAALLWLLVAGSCAMVRPARPGGAWSVHSRDGPERPLNPWLVGVVAAVGIAIIRACAEGVTAGPYFIVAVVTPAMTWLLFYAFLVLDTNRWDAAAGDHPIGLGLWLGAAALAFCLDNLVSFSLFVAGAGTTFVALAAVAIAVRSAGGADATTGGGDQAGAGARGGRWAWGVVLAAVTAAIVAHVGLNVIPVARVNMDLAAARADIGGAGEWPVPEAEPAIDATSAALYRQAIDADALDPVPPAEWARTLAASARGRSDEAEGLAEALRWVEVAEQRDPADSGLRRLEASLAQRRFAVTGDVADAERAVAATRAALERNPNAPDLYELLGDRLYSLGVATSSRDAIRQAAAAYERALALNAMRPAEEIRRFTESRVASIRAKLARCRQE
jgi:hypothetical protein